MRRSCILALATISLAACGDVKSMNMPDAAGGGDAAAADAANPCAPDTCLLSDDFGGSSLNASLWGMNVGGGATVSQANGVLSIKLPAVAGAFADVYSPARRLAASQAQRASQAV